MEERYERERRSVDRRITDIEIKLAQLRTDHMELKVEIKKDTTAIMAELKTIDALRNQIAGGVNLLKFFGFTGLGAAAIALVRYLAGK